MVELTVAEFVKYVSKHVRDPYGRQIGKIAAFISDTLGKVKTVVLEHGDGEYYGYSTECVTIEGDMIKILSELKAEANKVAKELELAWKKNLALEELRERKEVPQEVYEHFSPQYEATLKELKSRAAEVVEKIKGRIAELDSQARVLQLALASAKVSHRIGEIDDVFFNSIVNMIQTGMNRIAGERKDLEASIAELEKLITAPPVLPKISKEDTEALVVRIKE